MTCSVNEMRPQEASLFADGGEQCGSLEEFGAPDHSPGHIYDIGGSRLREILTHNLRNAITRAGPGRQRTLPSELFFYGDGLAKWCQITSLPEFYQSWNEINLLEHHGADIAKEIMPGSTVIDMGCGDTRKIMPLLLHIEKARIPINYYALDLSLDSLRVNVQALLSSPLKKFRYVRCYGLWGTFRDGFNLVRSIESPVVILSLGSMFGNDKFESAVSSLVPWARALKPGDRMLVGLDSESDEDEIWASYHDSQGVWEDFIRSGLRASNELLGHTWFSDEDWQVVGALNSNPTVHNFRTRALKRVKVPELGLDFSAGDSIDFFESWKHKPEIMRRQFKAAGLHELRCWKAPGKPFCESFGVSAPPYGASTTTLLNQILILYRRWEDEYLLAPTPGPTPCL